MVFAAKAPCLKAHEIADDYNAIESQAGSEQYQAVNCSIAY